MATFRDNAGREWSLAINIPVMKRVREKTGKHLGNVLKDDCALLMEIVEDVILFADVLRAMLWDQLRKQAVSDDEFDDALIGDASEDAVKAFWDAIVDFSPSRTRETLRSLASKSEQVRELAVSRAGPRLAKFMSLEPQVILDAISSKSAIVLPGSSESTPAS